MPGLTGTFIPQGLYLSDNTIENNHQGDSKLESNIFKEDGSNSIALSITDLNGSEYTFTNCSATGTNGPTQEQANNTYAGTSLDGSVTVTNGIQRWIVPQSGDYSITAAGASGGYTPNTPGGRGRIITMEIYLSQGDVLDILVGQEGGRGYLSNAYAGGGGGGTFIIRNEGAPLLVSGGGGGSAQGSGSWNVSLQGVDGSAHDNVNGSDGTGYSGSWNEVGPGGTQGNGGGASQYGGAGGGGFYSSGSNPGSGSYYAGTPGNSYLNGGWGTGGINRVFYGNFTTDIPGGFGGGAGAGLHSSFEANAGGGGGYSGGGGSNTRVGSGGGGGNYIGGTYISSDLNTGNGYVIISPMQAPNTSPTFLSTPVLDALNGSLYEYSISVNDEDGDNVAITATLKPDWLNLSNSILSGTPSSTDGGLHEIILTANDGNGGVITQSYMVAVSLHSLEITGESGFRILSSPVSGAIYGDLLEELWTQGAEGSDNANSSPNIWTYDNGWNPVTDLYNDELNAGQGFLIYIFADTDFDGEDDLPVTISIDSVQHQSAVSVVSEPSEWNLIGNPYGLAVDISQMLLDNSSRFNSTVYVLDLSNPGYKIHNGVVGNIENDEIKPFDGFWIQADTDGDVFEFTEQSIHRGHMNNNGRITTDGSNGSVVFTFTNGGYSSSTYLSFTPEGEINLDPADANRLVPLSPVEHLTSMIYESNKSLAINNLPYDLSTDIFIDMDVMMLYPTDDGYVTQTEQVDLTWDIANLPEGITLELRNNITGQNINLTGYPSANITLSSKGSFSTSGDFMATYPVVGQSHFTLSVHGTSVATDEHILPEKFILHSAYPNPFNPSTLISFDLPNANMVSLDIFDIAGKQVASLTNGYMIPGTHQISWNPGNISSGIYLVSMVVGNETFNQKITFIK